MQLLDKDVCTGNLLEDDSTQTHNAHKANSSCMALAGEIATDFPAKKVTLVHSGDCLLPDFPPKAGHLILNLLQTQGVEVSVPGCAATALASSHMRSVIFSGTQGALCFQC